MSGAGQFALPFPSAVSHAEADFVAGECSAEARAWLARWPLWPAGRLVLWGPEACGKSHLGAIWRARAGAALVPADSLAAGEAPALLGAARHALIEDADRAGRGRESERTLLHLLNLVAEEGGTALLTGREPPSRWPIGLPDLRSRLLAGGAVGISAPDEALLIAVLAKGLADRQLALDPEVGHYLVRRLPRSFAAMAEAARRLDALALAEGRRIGRALAARIVEGGET
ncbi:MAG: DnaA/Hda family protein [Acetobacteraceae bacterium]